MFKPSPSPPHRCLPTLPRYLQLLLSRDAMTETAAPAPAQETQQSEQSETLVEEPASAVAPVEPTPAPAATEDKEDDEPQNELTKKFTDEEWKALKELRVRVTQLRE